MGGNVTCVYIHRSNGATKRGENMKRKNLTVLVPMYNEECNVGPICRHIQETKEFMRLTGKRVVFDTIFINNGSTDKTSEDITYWVKKEKLNNCFRLNLPSPSRGYGYGLKEAIRLATTEYVGILRGDGQDDLVELLRLYKKLVSSPSISLVNGVREKHGLIRKPFSIAYNDLAYLLLNIRSKDINGSPKVFKRADARIETYVCDAFGFDAELLADLASQHKQYKDIRLIKSYDRINNKSKVNLLTPFKMFKELLRICGKR